jgi:hypothetical protein
MGFPSFSHFSLDISVMRPQSVDGLTAIGQDVVEG